MQDLLSSLTSPIVIGVIVLVLAILIALPLFLRRRRSPAEEEPPEFGEQIDYTSIETKEPTGWRERFANLSLAGKILVFVVPLLVVVGVIVLILLLSGTQTARTPTATPVPPPQITITEARLVGINPQRVRIAATSNLAPGTTVAAEMVVEDNVLVWFSPDETFETEADGAIEMTLTKAENGTAPTEGTNPAVQVKATVGGEEVRSDPQPINIPELPGYADAFFSDAVAVVEPTATEEPITPTAEEEATPAPTEPPTATTNPLGNTDRVATVSNGGNVREEPLFIDNVVDQINAGEQVEIVGRTPNGEWYFIRNIRRNEGWVSITLLSVDPTVAARVPVLNIVTVFTSGNVYPQPRAEGTVLDQVFATETVNLLQKTANGDWYRVETVREVTGWVSADLLGIPPEVATAVSTDGAATPANTPTAEEDAAETVTPTTEETPAAAPEESPVPDATEDTTQATAGLTARVLNTGSVRDQPDPNAEVLGEVNAGESVELLQKTPNATWFRIKNTQGMEGWVNSSLITVAPEVKERVPVG